MKVVPSEQEPDLFRRKAEQLMPLEKKLVELGRKLWGASTVWCWHFSGSTMRLVLGVKIKENSYQSYNESTIVLLGKYLVHKGGLLFVEWITQITKVSFYRWDSELQRKRCLTLFYSVGSQDLGFIKKSVFE